MNATNAFFSTDHRPAFRRMPLPPQAAGKHWRLAGLLMALGVVAGVGCQGNTREAAMEAAIQTAYEQRIADYERQHRWQCEAAALEQATVIADSIIAELYARTLRAQDTILVRPQRPDAPKVAIPDFPFDSIE